MIEQLIDAGRRVGAKQLTWGTAGNLSVRLPGGGRFAISGTGQRIDELTPERVVSCDVRGEAWEGDVRPSIEAGMHRGVYARRADAGAVLHSSAFFTTLVACSDVELAPGATSDTVYYLRRVARVPFHAPGSAALAEAVADAAVEHEAILLGNHGSVVHAPDLASAINLAEVLELMCRMVVAREQGFPLRTIALAAQADMLRSLAGYGAA